MRTRATHSVVLVVIAVAAVVAAVARLRTPRGPVIFAELQTAPGLRDGAAVSFRGIAVGHVTHIAFESTSVRLTLALDRADVPIRAADVVRLRPSGLLGDVGVEIVPVAGPSSALAVGGVLREADPLAFKRAWLRNIGVANPTATGGDSGARPKGAPQAVNAP